MSPPIITLLTDFGTADAYAGIMKGVVLGICPQARIVDLTHEVPPHDVTAGALLLRSAAAYFPAGTIHLAVVDPGVGGNRTAVLARTPRGYFVGPDNGLLYPAARDFGVQQVVTLNRPEYHLAPVSRTFHGRDVFAPVAAHLANGVAPENFGPAVSDLAPLVLPMSARLADGIAGEVIYADRFGNLVTNITRADLAGFPASGLSVSIAGCAPISLLGTYAEAQPGGLVALIGSWGQVEIAVRDGSAAQRLATGVGAAVSVKTV